MGTPFYMAPEIINRQVYDSKVDLWALGVLAYVLLSGGNFPFTGRTDRVLFNQIKSHRVELRYFDKYTNSSVLCDFVMHCLDRDPKTRYSAEQLLQHEWLVCTCETTVPDEELITIGKNFWDFQRSTQF